MKLGKVLATTAVSGMLAALAGCGGAPKAGESVRRAERLQGQGHVVPAGMND